MSTTIPPTAALAQIKSLLAANTAQINAVADAGIAYVPPVDPRLDVRDWLYPKTGKATRDTMVQVLPDSRWAIHYIKNSAAQFPRDVKTVTEDEVLFRLTDNQTLMTDPNVNGGKPYRLGWPPYGTPQAYRLYTTANASGSVGNIIMPRRYDPMLGRILVADCQNGTGLWYSDCNTAVPHTLGRFQTYLSLVKNFDFKGDLGVQDCLCAEYLYTLLKGSTQAVPLFKSKEIFRFTYESGWVQWEDYISTDGINWTLDPTFPVAVHNKYQPDYAAMPIQPCSIAL